MEFGPTTAPWQVQAILLRQAESYYKLAGLTDYEEGVRYERLLLHRDHEAKFWPRARSWILWAVWGWGERSWRVAATAGCLIVLFALGFWTAGVKPPDGRPATGFGDCLYLSTVTFTTLGYGDYLPVNPDGEVPVRLRGSAGHSLHRNVPGDVRKEVLGLTARQNPAGPALGPAGRIIPSPAPTALASSPG